MKKILLALICFFVFKAAYSQYPLTQNLGSDSTLISIGRNTNGGIKGRIIVQSSTDTTAANLLRVSQYAGALLFTTSDGYFWIRNSTATGWALIGSGSGSINIYNSNGTQTGNRVVTGGGYTLAFDAQSSIRFQPSGSNRTGLLYMDIDSIRLEPPFGRFIIDSLVTGASSDELLSWNATTRRVGRTTSLPDGFAWKLTGNSGTTAGTNFLGTTDAVDLVLKRNSTELMRLGSAGVGIGTTSPFSLLNIERNAIDSTHDDSFGIYLSNITPATTSMRVQYSPPIIWRGAAWKSSATAASQTQLFKAELVPLNGAPFTSAYWQLSQQINGAGYFPVVQARNNEINVLNSSGFYGNFNGIPIYSLSGSLFFGTVQNSSISVSNSVSIGGGLGATTGGANGNTSVGINALSTNTTGASNSGIGAFSLRDNTTGYSNTSLGMNSGLANTTGFQNSFIGAGAGEANTTGQENSFVGYDAGLNNTTGIYNNYFGVNAKGGSNAIGNNIIGYYSGASLTAGNQYNVGIGHNALYHASQKVDVTKSTAIGYNAYTTANNQLSISDSTTRFTFPGVSRGTANYVMTDSLGTGQYWVARPLSAIGLPINNLLNATGNTSVTGASYTYSASLINFSDILLQAGASAPGNSLRFNNSGNMVLAADNGELQLGAVSDIRLGSNLIGQSASFSHTTSNTSVFSIAGNSLTSGNLLNLSTTSTALASGNEGLNIGISGANGTNGITATGARISVTNTNATSGTNVGLDITASGATTDNIALQTTGRISIGGSITSSSLTSTRVIFAGASGLLTDNSSFTFGSSLLTTPHIKGGSGTPSIAAQASAGTGATATLSANSTDMAGEINLTSGTGTGTGDLVYIDFATAYGTAPFVVLTPSNDEASAAGTRGVYIESSTTRFKVKFSSTGDPFTESVSVKWFYHVIQ